MSEGNKFFDFQDLDDIILGAHFYGCGGGGAFENGLRLIEDAKQILQKRGLDYVKYLSPADVPDDGWLPVLGAIGSPQKYLKYGYGRSPVSAFLTHERLLQIRLCNPKLSFCSMIPTETGTVAHSMAILVAATLGLPVVDGDGAGRSIPSLQMVTFSNPDTQAKVQLSPCVLTSETAVKDGGVNLNFDCVNSSSVDALARGVISSCAGFEERASLSCFAMTGGQVKQTNAIVHNTLTKSRDLGRKIRNSTDPVKTIESLPTARLICQGEITKVDSFTRGGFDWLDVHIKADDDEYVVVAKNENMMVWSRKNDTPMVLSPDLISYIQPDGTVLSNTEIESHFKSSTSSMPVALFSMRADKAIDAPWFHKQYSEVFQSYGYYGPYHPPL